MTRQSLTWNPNEKGREGSLEAPGAGTWMQMQSKLAKHGGSCRYSPRSETSGGSWLAT
ncbi:hypothetical protein DPMN_006564 [Dreissena polymorpha]|uniref:Uncharacterized protein n=1 Tax=Dreissena polymorpha TaxID=45954 RepID=A0A9D4MU90_DREPO|nr:hypothetical protein DPMN_006564 [Dreissena polymorpha]